MGRLSFATAIEASGKSDVVSRSCNVIPGSSKQRIEVRQIGRKIDELSITERRVQNKQTARETFRGNELTSM